MGRLIHFGPPSAREAAFIEKLMAWTCLVVGLGSIIMLIALQPRSLKDWALVGTGGLFLIVMAILRLWGIAGQRRVVMERVATAVWIALSVWTLASSPMNYQSWLALAGFGLCAYMMHRRVTPRAPVQDRNRTSDAS